MEEERKEERVRFEKEELGSRFLLIFALGSFQTRMHEGSSLSIHENLDNFLIVNLVQMTGGPLYDCKTFA